MSTERPDFENKKYKTWRENEDDLIVWLQKAIWGIKPLSGNAVNHPNHYTHGSIETINVIEDWKLGYHLGQVIKYISRCDHKGKRLEDLKKAQWYLDREIEREVRRDKV